MIRIWDQALELMNNYCLRHSSRFPIHFLLFVVMSLIRRSRGKKYDERYNACFGIWITWGWDSREKKRPRYGATAKKNLKPAFFIWGKLTFQSWAITGAFSLIRKDKSQQECQTWTRDHMVSPIQMVARSSIHTACKISTTLTVPSSCFQSSILNLCSSSNWHLVVKEALKGDVGKGGRVDQRAHAVTYLSISIIVWVRLRLLILRRISTETKTTKLPIMSEIWL